SSREPGKGLALGIRKPYAGSASETLFQQTEPRVAQVAQVCEARCCAGGDIGNLALESADANLRTLEGRISKSALQNAHVLGQVDHKFILVKVAAMSPRNTVSDVADTDQTLVLIDQHAADERCRVE